MAATKGEAARPGDRLTVGTAVKAKGPQICVRGTPNLDPNFLISERLRALLEPNVVDRPYEKHGWVYAAIKRIGTNIAQTPVGMYVERAPEPELEALPMRALGNEEVHPRLRPAVVNRYVNADVRERVRGFPGRPELKELPASPWLTLFERPNPFLTGTDLWELTLIHLFSAGEAFWALDGLKGERRPGDVPSAIWLYPPKLFSPVLDRERGGFRGWRFRHGSTERIFMPWEVVHFVFPNPSDLLRGLSPMVPIGPDLRQDQKASEYNEAFFDNGAEPGVVLEAEDELTDDQVDRLQSKWEDRHRGPGKRSRPAVVHSGAKVTTLGTTQKDMDFLEQRRWNRGAVLAVTGVPEAELSIYGNLVESNAITQDRVFWTKTLIPVVRKLEATVWAQLFAGPEFMLFKLGDVPALTALLGAQIVSAERLFRIGYPINAINQRLELGLPKVPWGDVGYAPAAYVPYDELGAGEPANAPGGDEPGPGRPQEPEPGTKPEPSLPPSAGLVEPPPSAGLVEPPSSAGLVKPSLSPSFRIQRVAGGSTWNKIVAEVLAPSEARVRGKWRRWLRALRAEQLERLGAANRMLARAEKPAELTQEELLLLLFALGEWQRRLVGELRSEYARVAELAAARVSEELGGLLTFDLASPEVLQALSQREALIGRLPAGIRELLRTQLLEGLAAGESLEMLQGRVRRVFNFLSAPSRTLRVARTEVAQTANTVRFLAFKAEGVKKAWWRRAPDEKVRPDHVAFGALPPQPLGTNYMALIGKVGTLRFPGDPEGPAEEIVNCRCFLEAAREE